MSIAFDLFCLIDWLAIPTHWSSIGVQGAYQNRAIWRRLGQARDRIFEVVVTDPIKAVITAANLKADAGVN